MNGKKKALIIVIAFSLFSLVGCQTKHFRVEQSLKNFEGYTALIKDVALQHGLDVEEEEDKHPENGQNYKDLVIEISDTSKITIRMINSAYNSKTGAESFSIVYTVGEIDKINADLFLQFANAISGYEITDSFYNEFIQAPEEEYPSIKYGIEKSSEKNIYKLRATNFFADSMISYTLYSDSTEELSFGGLTKGLTFNEEGVSGEKEGKMIKIMWKEIAIILLVVFLIRIVFDLYMFFAHRKNADRFFARSFSGLEQRVKRLQKVCRFFSAGAGKKKIVLMYNDCCVIMASMALLNGDEDQFFFQLNSIKQENTYEYKSFVLALYYRSKGFDETAVKNYERYLSCVRNDRRIETIMSHLFAPPEDLGEFESVSAAAKQFNNPAIIKLLEENGIK